MAGRFLTGSKPSRTTICSPVYFDEGFAIGLKKKTSALYPALETIVQEDLIEGKLGIDVSENVYTGGKERAQELGMGIMTR